MGLNVCVYSNISKSGDQDLENLEETTHLFVHPLSVEDQHEFFPGRDEGVEAGVIYDFAHKHEFDLGYSDFNDWRRTLTTIEPGTPDAFLEIIEFPDNEGVIGPVVAKKLALDFQQFEPLAKLKGDNFYSTYLKWKRAFETAADNGAVKFQ